MNKWVSDRLAVIEEHGAIVSFGQVSFNNEDTRPGRISKVSVGADEPLTIRLWGAKNNLPQIREDLVNSNNIVPSMLGTKRDMILGAGLMTYRETFVDGKREVQEIEMPPAIRKWLDDTDGEKQILYAGRELMLHANVYTDFVRDRAGRIATMKTLRTAYVRAEEKDLTDRINHWYWSPGWALSKKDQRLAPPQKIPNYQRGKKQPKFILHTYDDICRTDDYYYAPAWWGGWQWIDLANAIPHFHRANVQHGYSIRYHIEVPSDYFDDNVPEMVTDEPVENAETRKAQAKEAFLDGLNNFLAGVKNAGRTVVTEYEINRQLGKDFPGIKITPLKVDLQDKALLELFDASNRANISAQAIHPTLANIETSGKLSSGSEIRNAFLMYLAIKTPTPRRILLEPLYLVARENGWDPTVKFGFRDIQLTTMDESKTGVVEDGSVTE
jgi:hypothetical protein